MDADNCFLTSPPLLYLSAPPDTRPQVLPLKHRSEVEGPFPITEEPSDHVLLAAEYKIDRPSGGGGGSNGSVGGSP